MVLNPWTWETHYLTDFIGSVLLSVSEKAGDALEIAAELALDPLDVEELSRKVEIALDDLESYGLVRAD